MRFVHQGRSQVQQLPHQPWGGTGAWPLVAHVARTNGSSETLDSSSNTIGAFWRRALFFLCGQRRLIQRSA
jgi:hypothetical protein